MARSSSARRGWRRLLPGWRGTRRLVQLLLLALFLVLFRLTDYRGQDILTAPTNLFFRMDPLVGGAAMLAGRMLVRAFWPAVIILVLTLILGRFFCGWICPLGTLLDLFHRLISSLARRTNRRFRSRRFISTRHNPGGVAPLKLRSLRYMLLIFVLVSAGLGLPLVGYLDPFAILTRSAALVIDPAAYNGVGAVVGPDHPAYPYFRDYILPFAHKTYSLVTTSLLILVIVFAMELLARRFWCRYLCPLGAAFGSVSRFSLLRRLPVKSCGKCPAAADCVATCRMGAFDNPQSSVSPDECTLCMDCVADCPANVSRFTFRRPARRSASTARPAPVDLSRRAALTTIAMGVALPAVVKAARIGRSTPNDPYLLRPPGAHQDFNDRCVRCGLCLKVCPTNGLQPAALQAGFEGIFSPVLVPRIGYCEFSCTLCGQVCPTEAIPRLSPEQKSKAIIGKAVIDEDRCLPWAKNEECICCEEHCPVSDKAVQYDQVQVRNAAGEMLTLQRPYIVLDRCIGCGICEKNCPVEGESAIRVKQTQAVPKQAPGHRRRGRGRGQGRGLHRAQEGT